MTVSNLFIPDEYRLAKHRVANSFNRAALSYDRFAVLQKEVAEALLEKVDSSLAPARILDLGSGTGYCTVGLQKKFPGAEIVSLDIAEAMLKHARQTHQLEGTCICADAEALPFKDGSFDLVVSSLAIQWCQSYRRLFKDLHRIINDQGMIYVSTFGPDTLLELKRAWQTADQDVHVNYFADSVQLQDSISDSGFREVHLQQERMRRFYASLRDLRQELKSIGAGNLNSGQPRGLGRRQTLSIVRDNFEDGYEQDQGIPVTYDVYYLTLGSPEHPGR